MGLTWRLVDTGLRSASHNIALDRALLEARRAEEIPTTLRFFRMTRSVLLAHGQSASQECNTERCRERGISVQRRISGGAPLYVDSSQLGWALYVHRRELAGNDLRSVSRHLGHALAAAIAALGIDARVRRYDEVEVDGRSIEFHGFAADGDAALFCGTIFLRLDLEEFVEALRFPVTDRERLRAAAAQRFTDMAVSVGRDQDAGVVKQNVTEALESAFEVEIAEGDLGLSEEARYRAALREIDTEEWVNLVARPASEAPRFEPRETAAAGDLRAAVICDVSRQVLKRVWFDMRAAVNPRRTLPDLEAALRDLAFASLPRAINAFFASHPVSSPVFTAEACASVLARATGQPLIVRNGAGT